MLPREIAARVGALPERYQPIFGHPEMDEGVARNCVDRLVEIQRVVDALREVLGRPVRILDLGCAQGFFAFSLASRGDEVTGVDRLDVNVELCRALAGEHAGLPVQFIQADAADVLANVQPGSYDIVLALSVLHHMCHERGAEPIARLLGDVASSIEVLLAEVAVREEPLYWAAAQPADPRGLFAAYPFVHDVTWHATHLSAIERPLIFASSQWCWLGGMLSGFDDWSTVSRKGVEDVHRGTRRYYFSRDRLIKYFRLTGESADRNRDELGREAAFLSDPPPGLPVPAIIAAGMDDHHAFLVRQLVPGQLLSEAIAQGQPFDRVAVVDDVLEQLCVLEAIGLHHGDVRTWNVLLRGDGRGILIDYGDITAVAQDCAWPGNLFLSFLVFVREIESDQVLRVLPLRTIAFSPQHFTAAFRSWVAALWTRPIDEWTFTWLRDTLRHAGHATERDVKVAAPTWEFAIERYLEVVAAHQKRLADMIDQVARDGDERAQAVAQLAAAMSDGRTASNTFAAAVEAVETGIEARLDAMLVRLDRIEAVGQASATIVQALDQKDVLLAEKNTEIERKNVEIERKNVEIERNRVEAAHWWRATGELQHELETVYSTLSWRVTAPLRVAKRLLGGPRMSGPPPATPAARSGVRGAVARFVRRRPRLKRWIAGPLDRFPGTRERVKRYFVSAAALPVVADGSPAALDDLGRGATEVYAELKQEIARRNGDPSRAA